MSYGIEDGSRGALVIVSTTPCPVSGRRVRLTGEQIVEFNTAMDISRGPLSSSSTDLSNSAPISPYSCSLSSLPCSDSPPKSFLSGPEPDSPSSDLSLSFITQHSVSVPSRMVSSCPDCREKPTIPARRDAWRLDLTVGFTCGNLVHGSYLEGSGADVHIPTTVEECCQCPPRAVPLVPAYNLQARQDPMPYARSHRCRSSRTHPGAGPRTAAW